MGCSEEHATITCNYGYHPIFDCINITWWCRYKHIIAIYLAFVFFVCPSVRSGTLCVLVVSITWSNLFAYIKVLVHYFLQDQPMSCTIQYESNKFTTNDNSYMYTVTYQWWHSYQFGYLYYIKINNNNIMWSILANVCSIRALVTYSEFEQ